MNVEDLAHRIRLEAQLIPIAGTKRIRGSEPISAYNLALHVAEMLEAASRGEMIYPFMCGQPAKLIEGVRSATMPHVADSPTDLVDRWRNAYAPASVVGCRTCEGDGVLVGASGVMNEDDQICPTCGGTGKELA